MSTKKLTKTLDTGKNVAVLSIGMKLTREQLIREYVTMHQEKPEYGIGDTGRGPIVVDFFRQHGVHSVVEFGCGKGKMVWYLNAAGFDAEGYDPAIPEFQDLPIGRVDAVLSMDVFEHFHPDHVLDELHLIRDGWQPRVCLFAICCREAGAKLPSTGEQCHTVLWAPEKWESAVRYVFEEHR